MLPVAILPAAGILLAFGNAMHNEQLVHLAPWLNHPVFVAISSVMEASGQVVFDNLPLLFAIGTALGLAGGECSSTCSTSRLPYYECDNG